MEHAISLFSSEQARLRRISRKRERESVLLAKPNSSETTEVATDSTDATETVQLEGGIESLACLESLDSNTRNHICACIVSICSNTHALSRGKSFVARSTLGAFLAAQSANPTPLGPLWIGLVYVCFEIVSASFLGASDPQKQEPLRREVVTDMLHYLGTTPHSSNGSSVNMADNDLVRASRRWSRFEHSTLVEVVNQAWKVTDLPRVRLALEGVLSNCASAKYLF